MGVVRFKKEAVRAAVSSWRPFQNFFSKISHRIFGHMYKVLNIDKKKKLIAQFVWKSRDEFFEPN